MGSGVRRYQFWSLSVFRKNLLFCWEKNLFVSIGVGHYLVFLGKTHNFVGKKNLFVSISILVSILGKTPRCFGEKNLQIAHQCHIYGVLSLLVTHFQACYSLNYFTLLSMYTITIQYFPLRTYCTLLLL